MVDFPVFRRDGNDFIHSSTSCPQAVPPLRSDFDFNPAGVCQCVNASCPGNIIKLHLQKFAKALSELSLYGVQDYSQLTLPAREKLVERFFHYSYMFDHGWVERDRVTFKGSAYEEYTNAVADTIEKFLELSTVWVRSEQHQSFELKQFSDYITNYHKQFNPSRPFPGLGELVWAAVEHKPNESTPRNRCAYVLAELQEGKHLLVQGPRALFSVGQECIVSGSADPETVETAFLLFCTGGLYESFSKAYEAAASV